MRTILWWSRWGLVVSIGIIALLEAHHNPLHLLLGIPVLAGATAAAVLRMKHEYHEAMQHAKWVAVTSVFLLAGSGYFYLKSNAYGPFATGTSHKAFLRATFEMSLPEVERAIGQKLAEGEDAKTLQERAEGWVLDALPMPGRRLDDHYTTSLSLYHVPCQATFDFMSGKLGRVALALTTESKEKTDDLLKQLRADLSKDYKQADDAGFLFRKDAVDAIITATPLAEGRYAVSVVLRYLPFVAQDPAPLTVENNAF